MKNENLKILWAEPFPISEGIRKWANKIDTAVYDKQTNDWTLVEGTVCQVGKTAKKQKKFADLREGIKELYKSTNQ